MGEVDFHSTGKVREDTNISKLWVSQTFWVKQKSIQFPKHGESGFPQYRKSMGEHKHFKFMGSLSILGEAESIQFPKHGESGFP